MECVMIAIGNQKQVTTQKNHPEKDVNQKGEVDIRIQPLFLIVCIPQMYQYHWFYHLVDNSH